MRARLDGLLPGLHSLSSDIDFFGTRASARQAAANISAATSFEAPDIADAGGTPNTALLTVRLPGYDEPVFIDFLSGIVRVSDEDIRKTAVELDYHGARFKILHPLLCMESKVLNLYHLPSKQTPEGEAQAKISVSIVRAWLESQLVAGGAARELLKPIERITRFAGGEAAVAVRHDWEVEVLSALPIGAIKVQTGPQWAMFRDKRLPQVRAEISKADARYQALLERRAKLAARKRIGIAKGQLEVPDEIDGNRDELSRLFKRPEAPE